MRGNNVPGLVIQEIVSRQLVQTTMAPYARADLETQRLGTRAIAERLADAPATTTFSSMPCKEPDRRVGIL